MVLNCEYGSLGDQSYDAYSAIVNNVAVCEVYATAFKLFMAYLGNENYYAVGMARGTGHSWNIVKIDGDYFNVDVTWDDPASDNSELLRYNYFNITDQKLPKDHTWKTDLFPAANGTKWTVDR